MKRQLLLCTLLLSFMSLTEAGEYSVYPKVHFQQASTWVSAQYTCVYHDQILHQSKDFKLVSFCDEDGQNCNFENRPLVQPIISTNQRCKTFKSDECVDWETYDYVQGPVVKVKVYPSESEARKEHNLKKVIDYKLKECTNI